MPVGDEGEEDGAGTEEGGFIVEDDGIEMDEGGFVKGSVRRKRGAPAASSNGDDDNEDEEGGGFILDDQDEDEDEDGDLDLNALVESDVDGATEDEYDDAQNNDTDDGEDSAQASSGDEYNDVTTRSGKKIIKGKGRSSNTTVGKSRTGVNRRVINSSSSSPGPPPSITPRQKAEARKTFALFSKSASNTDLSGLLENASSISII